jgi:hypothetical protein
LTSISMCLSIRKNTISSSYDIIELGRTSSVISISESSTSVTSHILYKNYISMDIY